MAPISACPDAPRLQQFLHGLVTDREAAPLEEHLEHCATCLQTLRSLPADDTLHEAAGGGSGLGESPAVGAATTADLIRRLKALRPARDAAGQTPTPATFNPAPASEHVAPATYDFLAPPSSAMSWVGSAPIVSCTCWVPAAWESSSWRRTSS
jgi:hypothetical protein